MSEKFYGWLLRLYPRHFREIYGDAALQLFRDRARDEKGFLPQLRLWLDLLTDLAITMPLERRDVQPALIPDGTPSFQFLEGESIRFPALFFGALLSLVAFGFCFMIGQLGNPRPFLAGFGGFPQSGVQESAPPNPTERRTVIDAAIANVKQHYVDPEVGQKMADALLAHEKSGDYDAPMDNRAFANLVTQHMREVSHDPHLDFVYSPTPLPNGPPGPESRARYQKALEDENCTFEKIAIRPHNIGYLKINTFPDVEFCKSTASAAMATLNHADAIIFDLRDNRGGYDNMVSLLAAYLFDHPEFLYSPRENITEQSWTRSPVPGNRLADKPVYVLTSSRTMSAAEQFSYDLKMLKRATFVGETTRGAAHAAVFHRIDDHFGMGITETRPMNPFSKTDWEGTGVEPDVKVNAADALATAEKLAQSNLRKK